MNPPSPGPREPAADLLAVDDSPANLQLLGDMLRQQGYKVRPVPSGPLALQAARQKPPDLVLLDINMPGMNGYQVCEQLKADAALKDIPVIFISALDEVMDKVQAFSVGGVDYVTKPFQFEEVHARIRTHLALYRQERQLRELERLRDSLVHMVVHDMRSPLFVIRMSLDLIQMRLPADASAMADLLQPAHKAIIGLSEMTTQLLDISRLETKQMPVSRQRGDLVQTVRETLAGVRTLADKRQVELLAPPACPLDYDRDLVTRIIANLLTNAFKFTPPTGKVTVTLSLAADQARVAVTDTGSGIAPEKLGQLFQKFSQLDVRDRRLGSGLGLAYCRLAVEAHGGKIGVDSDVGRGSTFWFSLPLTPPAAPAP